MNLGRFSSKALHALSILITAVGCFFVAFLGFLIFVFDTYPVNTGSMTPAILPGDRIVVNKLIFGARLYKNLDFLKGGALKTLRMKGFKSINYNDVVVFNRTYPLSFDIRKVYVKRCIGLPGDTIWIRNGQYQNSSIKTQLLMEHFTPKTTEYATDRMFECYPYKEALSWTIWNFGPLYMPRKGERIELNQTNIWLYLRLIRYENGSDIQFERDTVFWNNQPLQTYTFKENYYFMAGDNFANSADSRYFGPIPETFIVGVVPLKINAKQRWERL
ncbi:MAG: signal peptidase I [Bacteroidetes bacterium]|nr:signal peptidase I [Bacteroidota bacterium]